MIYDERRVIYREAIAEYGAPAQIIVAMEELSECIKALSKWLRYGPTEIPGIIEEVADATIMLEQIRLIFGINEEVSDEMERKCLRLRERMWEKD